MSSMALHRATSIVLLLALASRAMPASLARSAVNEVETERDRHRPHPANVGWEALSPSSRHPSAGWTLRNLLWPLYNIFQQLVGLETELLWHGCRSRGVRVVFALVAIRANPCPEPVSLGLPVAPWRNLCRVARCHTIGRSVRVADHSSGQPDPGLQFVVIAGPGPFRMDRISSDTLSSAGLAGCTGRRLPVWVFFVRTRPPNGASKPDCGVPSATSGAVMHSLCAGRS